MAGSINKVILIGNLGKDPEIRRFENGGVVANFPLATTETYVDKSTGERRDITDWHNIVVWRGLADVVERYVKKGSKIYVEGKLKTRSWTDKEGVTRYITEVVADNLTMLSRSENNVAKPIEPNFSSQGVTSVLSPMEQISQASHLEGNFVNEDIDDLPF